MLVAVGAAGDTDRPAIRGYAQVHVFDGNHWVQLGRNIFGEDEGDRAGHGIALSMDGRTLAVGSTFYDGFSGSDTGHARVYRYQNNTKDWSQIGLAIEGEKTGDQFGRRIALVEAEGNGGVIQLAIGSQVIDSDDAENIGAIKLYTIESSCVTAWSRSPARNGSPTIAPSVSPTISPDSCEWSQRGDGIFGRGFGDALGEAVVLSGDGRTLAVGAWAAISGFVEGSQRISLPGAVRVYNLTEDNLIGAQLGNDITGAVSFTEFPFGDMAGAIVDLSYDGRVLAIGAPKSNADLSGRVRVYRYSDSSENWIQIGADFVGSQRQASLGSSIALSSDGGMIAIGEDFYLSDDIPGGRVRLFRLTEADVWEQVGNDLFGNDLADELNLSNPRFGSSLALSLDGKTIVIGAYQSDIQGEMSGRVHIFLFNEVTGWRRLGDAIAGRGELEGFGHRVAASVNCRTIAVVSRPQGSSTSGIVRVFSLSLDMEWSQIGNDILGEGSDGTGNRDRGLSVDLSDDGQVLAVGATGPFGDTGSVRVFRFKSSLNIWLLVGSNIAGQAPGGQFGSALSISTNSPQTVLAVGSRFNGEDSIDAGRVLVFSLNSTCIEDDIRYDFVEAHIDSVSIELRGIETKLNTDGQRIFEEVTQIWFENYYLEYVPTVRDVKSRFFVQEQNVQPTTNVSVAPTLSILYSQRMSYVVREDNNATSKTFALLPFEDEIAVIEYTQSLRASSPIFAQVSLPVNSIVILDSSPVETEKTRSVLSSGLISGIVVGSFAFAILLALFAYRVYRSRLPVAQPVTREVIEDDASSDLALAYPVDENTGSIVDSHQEHEASQQKQQPGYKDQVHPFRHSNNKHGSASETIQPQTKENHARKGPGFKDQIRNNVDRQELNLGNEKTNECDLKDTLERGTQASRPLEPSGLFDHLKASDCNPQRSTRLDP